MILKMSWLATCFIFELIEVGAAPDLSRDGSTVRKYGTLVRYTFCVKVRVRYVGTLFECVY